MSGWNDLIQKIYNENKHKPGYKLKNAMKAASPIWAKMKKSVSNKKSKTQQGGKKKGKGTKKRR